MSIIHFSTDDDVLNVVRTEHQQTPIRELLKKSPRILLGVSDTAETALKLLDVNTVFDLATSTVFEAAAKLTNAGNNMRTALYQHGEPTADLVRDTVAGQPVAELQFKSVEILQGIPPAEADQIKTALDVELVRDLALYPPFRAAVALMTAVYFPENAAGFDPEQPADLLPKTGEYPTERVQYTSLIMGEIPQSNDKPLKNVVSDNFTPINLARLAEADAGFKKVAFGALLTFNQSWYAQGVTLGQLLHSTSLAPGESTRIAVIDWTRRSRAGQTEAIGESDHLDNTQFRNRSINEVTEAVANEAQEGFSRTNAHSRSSQSGSSEAFEMSVPLGGLFGGPSGASGSTNSMANSLSAVDSYSTSWGRRDIASDMTQQINDRTHQYAHSNRSRRASVVKEVSQSEHESVSTRVLANYNHMHALTIQYYEVVQVYRVEVALARAERVIFIPMSLIDFNNDMMVQRFQNVLMWNALSYEMREALRDLDVIELEPVRQTTFTNAGHLKVAIAEAFIADPIKSSIVTTEKPIVELDLPHGAEISEEISEHFKQATSKPVDKAAAFPATYPHTSSMEKRTVSLWEVGQGMRLAGLLNLNVFRPTNNSLYLPTDIIIESWEIEHRGGADGTDLGLVFKDLSGSTVTVSPQTAIPLNQLDEITIRRTNTERSLSATVTLTVKRNGVRFPITLPGVEVPSGRRTIRIVKIKTGAVSVSLNKHLNDNKMHYSQAVFRSLDSTEIALLLSGYGVDVSGQTVPVAQVVDPVPVAYIGNYLAFKMASDVATDETWKQWLDDHGITLGSTKEDIIPLASGGTFAEAVLGRSNSAEKLDMTRFWNWQDSPIPLLPSDIAAIQTGSRAISEDIRPGQLSNPIINMASPTSLPDPAGTAAILAAIQNGNMFRDMSGLQGTIGLAQAGIDATSAGAATAGQQAGTNMNNLLKANTERQRIAAEMVTSLAKTAASAYTGGIAGGGGGISSGGGNHSQDGAKVNYFDKTKGQVPANSAGSSSNGGAPAPVLNSGQSGGTSQVNDNGSGGSGENYSQNPAALAATWGDTQSPSGFVDGLMNVSNERYASNLQDEISTLPVDIDIKLRLFIPSEAVVVDSPPPLQLLTLLGAFGGDNRSFDYSAGSSRVEIHLVVRTHTNYSKSGLQPKSTLRFGETTRYDVSQTEQVAGKPEWFHKLKPNASPVERKTLAVVKKGDKPDDPDKFNLDATVTASTATKDIKIELAVEANNPLAPGSPDIDAKFTIEIVYAGGTLRYKIEGKHDGFPAYELYIDRARVYEHDPVATNEGPLSLPFPMDKSVKIGLTTFKHLELIPSQSNLGFA